MVESVRQCAPLHPFKGVHGYTDRKIERTTWWQQVCGIDLSSRRKLCYLFSVECLVVFH